jgi:hypothetical protein
LARLTRFKAGLSECDNILKGYNVTKNVDLHEGEKKALKKYFSRAG